MMVIYHTAFDLLSFYNWNIDLYSPQWEVFRIITVSLFLLCSGMSSQLSSHPLRRASTILGSAGFITLATYIYDPNTFIYFGILHCIGLGMLLLIPLKKLKEWNIVLGIIIILFPFSSYYFPLPIRPTLDFYPIIPWFGIMLIGAGISHFLYVRNSIILIRPLVLTPALTLISRHALLIYMTHQPILLALLYLLYAR